MDCFLLRCFTRSSPPVITPMSTLQSSKLAVICPACLIYSAKLCLRPHCIAFVPTSAKPALYRSLKYMWRVYMGSDRRANHMNAHTRMLCLTPGLYLFYLDNFICSDMQALTFKSDQLFLGFPNVHVEPEGGVCHFYISVY